MQTLSGNHHRDLLTAPMKMSLVPRVPRKMHLCRSSSNVPRLPSFLEMLQNLHVLLTFERVHNPLRLPCETTSEPPKVVRAWCVLHILASKCASRRNGVHFSTSQLPKVVRAWCVLYMLTSKCASRHNGTACTFSTSQLPKVVREMVCFVHVDFEMCFAPQRHGVHFLDISTSKSGPRMVCFVHVDFEMCFAPQRRAFFNLSSGQLALHPPLYDPPEPQIIGKTQCFATFLPFRAPVSSFF